MFITVNKKGNLYTATYKKNNRTVSAEGENKEEVLKDLGDLLQELGIDHSRELEKCLITETAFKLSQSK